MALPQAIQAVEAQEWTEPVDTAMESAVVRAAEAAGPTGQAIRNLLHGTWLGHPLHPAVISLPLGAWSVALLLDVMDRGEGRNGLAAGADTAVAVGLAGAVAAAVTGLNDWERTGGEARKVGVVHGALNGGATLLYGASLLLRRRGARPAGRALSYLGYGAVLAAAYLGGHLVYGQGVGVDHARRHAAPDEFLPVLPDSDLTDGQLRRVDAGEMPVLLARQWGRLYALGDTCSHLGCSLAQGSLEPGAVRCPCHGSRFSLADGSVLDGPATFPQPCLEARVRDGRIEVCGKG